MTLRERFLAQAGIREATLVHYDIRESDARARRELSRFLTGRMEVRATKKGLKKHRYAGLPAKGDGAWGSPYSSSSPITRTS